MSPVAAVEAALAESPDDPLVYAAYADALADVGDPRGEFHRLLAALDGPTCPNRPAVERELRRHWQMHASGWVTPAVRRLGRVGFYSTEGAVPLWRLRGLAAEAGQALTDSPLRWLLRGVKVEPGNGEPADVGPFFAALGRTRVRTLTVQGGLVSQFRDDGVEALIASGLLDRLTALSLPNHGITDTGAELLAAHPRTPLLRPLDLSHNLLSPVGRQALAAVGVRVSDDQLFLPGGSESR